MAKFFRVKTVDLVVGILVVAAALVWVALMLQNLGVLSLWMDEGFHYLAAEGILKHGTPLFPSGHVYYKAIFYTYVLGFLSAIFGLSAVTLRVVSVVCVGALLPLTYYVGKKFFDRTIGLLAAAILALSVWEIEYARLALYFAPLTLFYLAGVFFFYRGFFRDQKKYKIWATVFFLLTPQIHQLGQGVVFCFAALFLMKGAKRFFRKDVLLSAGIVGLASLALQLHEYFFWKVGYVYFKDDKSLGGMISYFFGGFSLDYFKEFFRSFPWMSLAVLAGIFLCIGTVLRKRGADAVAGELPPSASSPWLYLNFCLVFPLFFFAFFRTHVQPRYLAQLFPIFVLLFLAALQSLSRSLVGWLILPSLGVRRPKHVGAVTLLVFLGLVLGLVEGAGPGGFRSIVGRRYGDPITADIITRSGRFEHYDHRGAGEYARHFLKEDDIVVAIHVVFQKIYTGRVDYWLWSGGPGTWDAWEQTPDGWKDFYVGARWLNNLADLRRVIEENPGRRVWLVGSPSLLRRDHINQEIYDYIAVQNADKLVYRGKDAMSEVYLWNDPEFAASPRRAAEGESFPSRRGRVAYGGGLSKSAAIAWPGTQKKADDFIVKVGRPFGAGTYRVVVRYRTSGEASSADRAAVLAVIDGRGGRLRSLTLSGGGSASGWREAAASFVLARDEEVRFRLTVPPGCALDIDYADLVPGEEPR